MLTDKGTHFTDPTGDGWTPEDIRAMRAEKVPLRCHSFWAACADLDIEHRLTKPRHPWTNGQVERMNRTIKDATVIAPEPRSCRGPTQRGAKGCAMNLVVTSVVSAILTILADSPSNPIRFVGKRGHKPRSPSVSRPRLLDAALASLTNIGRAAQTSPAILRSPSFCAGFVGDHEKTRMGSAFCKVFVWCSRS